MQTSTPVRLTSPPKSLARRAIRRRLPQAAAAPAAGPAPELLTPAQVAELLSVTEGDVIASIEGGNLKAKKIGAQYRITKAAMDAFLAS